ncbi:MAG TPA: riboflavin synthase [Peptococcaceae bacterium]|nr:MAG: Riboflavin synthase, alpha subunit [Moorella sp. 60_41]HBT46362.1 riboflavin synthase [Peptococcaceae bacterium]
MFTGIIEEIGTVRNLKLEGENARLVIGARKVLEGTQIGDSVAVNGVCLTVVELLDDGLAVEMMAETLRVTNLGRLRPGEGVNLERALRLGDRLGGHLVSGHVDGVVRILSRRRVGTAEELELELPPNVRPYVVPKGSVALDGTSLTVIARRGDSFSVGLIPHTLRETVLGRKRVGDEVNMEVDWLARYLEGLLRARDSEGSAGLNMDFLARYGFV